MEHNQQKDDGWSYDGDFVEKFFGSGCGGCHIKCLYLYVSLKMPLKRLSFYCFHENFVLYFHGFMHYSPFPLTSLFLRLSNRGNG